MPVWYHITNWSQWGFLWQTRWRPSVWQFWHFCHVFLAKRPSSNISREKKASLILPISSSSRSLMTVFLIMQSRPIATVALFWCSGVITIRTILLPGHLSLLLDISGEKYLCTLTASCCNLRFSRSLDFLTKLFNSCRCCLYDFSPAVSIVFFTNGLYSYWDSVIDI